MFSFGTENSRACDKQTFIRLLSQSFKWNTARAKASVIFLKKAAHAYTARRWKKSIALTNRERFGLPFSGPPAFDLSTSCHACWPPVHPSLVPIQNTSRVKSREVSWRESSRLQFPNESPCPAHAFTRTRAVHGKVVVCTVKMCPWVLSEERRFGRETGQIPLTVRWATERWYHLDDWREGEHWRWLSARRVQ